MIRFNSILFIGILLLTCAPISAFSQDAATLAQIKYHTEKVKKYLDKNNALSGFYSIDKEGIKIYASAKDKLAKKIELFVSWSMIPYFNDNIKRYSTEKMIDVFFKTQEFKLREGGYIDAIYSKREEIIVDKKLKGLKIAIDPGHTAGDMETGWIEQKCLNFKCDSLKGLKEPIAISEGMLTFATAKLLKGKLEAEGAEVFMTRTFDGGSAFGFSFEYFLKKKTIDSLYAAGVLNIKQKTILLDPKKSKRDKFRFVFKDLELQKRAEIINNYHPDYTIIIHYNVDETNTGWTNPANKNFNMTFVGGAFMKNDLSTPEKRFEFLRLLISKDLENSIALSSSMVKSFEKVLNVKTAKATDATYLIQGCLTTGELGVYCRNLQLTRYIHGPLVYGETLYQDNIMECIALNKECDKTKNQRVQQVAEAYFQGVLTYTRQ